MNEQDPLYRIVFDTLLLSAQVLFNVFISIKETNTIIILPDTLSCVSVCRFNGYRLNPLVKMESHRLYVLKLNKYIELVLFAFAVSYHNPYVFVFGIDILPIDTPLVF